MIARRATSHPMQMKKFRDLDWLPLAGRQGPLQLASHFRARYAVLSATPATSELLAQVDSLCQMNPFTDKNKEEK